MTGIRWNRVELTYVKRTPSKTHASKELRRIVLIVVLLGACLLAWVVA